MYRALVSFSGRISMAKGEVREISDKSMVKDLLSAKYIEEVMTEKPKSEKSVRKKSAKKKTTKGKEKKDDFIE